MEWSSRTDCVARLFNFFYHIVGKKDSYLFPKKIFPIFSHISQKYGSQSVLKDHSRFFCLNWFTSSKIYLFSFKRNDSKCKWKIFYIVIFYSKLKTLLQLAKFLLQQPVKLTEQEEFSYVQLPKPTYFAFFSLHKHFHKFCNNFHFIPLNFCYQTYDALSQSCWLLVHSNKPIRTHGWNFE